MFRPLFIDSEEIFPKKINRSLFLLGRMNQIFEQKVNRIFISSKVFLKISTNFILINLNVLVR